MKKHNLPLVFQALNDPTRFGILQKLSKHELTPSELSVYFPISQPSLSHHLSLLKQAGIITGRRSGQKIIYSLDRLGLKDQIRKSLAIF